MQRMPLIAGDCQVLNLTYNDPVVRLTGNVMEGVRDKDTVAGQTVMKSIPRAGGAIPDAATHKKKEEDMYVFEQKGLLETDGRNDGRFRLSLSYTAGMQEGTGESC